MNPKYRKEMQRLNLELSSNSWKNFLELISSVSKTHSASIPSFSYFSGLLRNRNVDGLVAYADSLVSQKYETAAEHFAANQLAALLRKFPYPKGSNQFDPEGEAKRKFDKAEHHCSRLNQRFRAFRKRSPYECELSRMRNFVRYVLGDSPDLGQVYTHCSFGPGANVGVHGNATNVARKLLSSSWSVSPGAFAYGYAALVGDSHVFELLARDTDDSRFYSRDRELFYRAYAKRTQMVTYNKIAFVPKTVKTHRAIAVEPLVNGYLQKGVDVVMRHCLLRTGIDLSDQSINMKLAREGSLNDTEDGFVTIDLSSASDSISIGLCENLLPPDWFAFLNAIRSKEYSSSGVVKRYHKFCSMGNGFCFPLESLIFTAVCVACGAGIPGRDFHVYGDDIIVRKRFAEKILDLLKVCGFEVNSDKTFIEGPFRESCGADWFNGEDVRPFTLDFALDNLENVFKFLNLSQRNERSTAFFAGIREFIISLLPKHFRFCRPFPGEADTGYVVELDSFMSSPFAKWNSALQCWSWRELKRTPVADRSWHLLKGNDIALVFGALRGVKSARPFTVRRETRMKVRLVSHSGTCSTWVPAPRVA